MEIVTTGEQIVFVEEIVKKRGFLRGKHITWENSRNGLITFASPGYIQVLFLTGVHSSASYFLIRAAEVARGEWTLLYSNDLEKIYSVGQGD